MKSFKNIVKKIGQYLIKLILFILSLIIIGVVAGLTYYIAVEYHFRDKDTQFIQDCMAEGHSEEVCKGRVY